MEDAYIELIEAAAEGEDALLEKYLDSGELTNEELMRGLKKVVLSGDFVPVFCTAGGREIGIGPWLNAMVDIAPSPADAPARTAQGKDGDEESYNFV